MLLNRGDIANLRSELQKVKEESMHSTVSISELEVSINGRKRLHARSIASSSLAANVAAVLPCLLPVASS